jgi:hypothetical protein
MADHAERRLVIRVHHIWQKVSGNSYPRRSQIDPAVFGADWAYCFMIDLDQVPGRSRFSHLGHALRDLTWPTFERQSVGECLEGSLLELATRQIPQLLEKKRAQSFAGSAFHQDADILYRTILLPLSENGKEIDGVLGAIGYREIAPEYDLHAKRQASGRQATTAN